MVAITGTYDVMLVPLLVPIVHVLNMLPPQVRDIEPSPLIPFTHTQIESLGLHPESYNAAENHPVMLELGYQDHTGPGPRILRLSFDEAKVDILGMRHPHMGDQQTFSADKGFVFKQMIMFSNPLLATSSSLIAGLRSKLVTVTPHKSPSIYPVGQDDNIEYKVSDHIDTAFTKTGESVEINSAVRWAGRPWYGWRVSDTLTQFKFDLDPALIGPVPYRGKVQLQVAKLYDPSKISEADSVTPEWTDFKESSAWRLKANYASQDIAVKDALT